MSQDEHFKRGVEYFRENKLEDALEMLDKALVDGMKDRRMLDTRAAILEKMGVLEEALKGCRKVIDVAPSAWQGYARAARIFLKLKRPESSLTMVDLALERMSTDVSGQARRAEMEQTRLEARKLARKLHKRSFFDYIPIEILYSVFTLLAMSNPLEAIKQRAVCRRWRDVLNNIPSLWNSLVLRPKTPQKKIEIWLNRSGGALKSLSIRDGFVFEARPQIQQRHFGNDFWEKLEELEIECGEHMESLQEVLPRGTLSHLRLQKLSITTADGPRPRAMSGHSRSFWGLLEHSCSQPQSLQTLIFNSPVTFPWQHVEACTDLRTLAIECCDISSTILFPFLSQNSSLEILDLSDFKKSALALPEEEYNIELPHLSACGFSSLETDLHLYLSRIRAPNLTVLSINRVHRNTQFQSALRDLSLPHLQEFRLSSSRMDNTSKLLSFLKKSPLLRRLTYSGCFPADVNEVIDGLAIMRPANGENAATTELVCPLLEDLDLSSNQFLRGTTLSRLTKSRTTHGEGGKEKCSLMSLEVSNCESLDPAAFPWLRSRIKRVSYRMTKATSRTASVVGAYTLI